MTPPKTPPATPRDLWSIAGGVAFAATLLSPLRHYIGSTKQVTKAKFDEDSFPLSTYPMFSADRKGRIVVPHVVGFTLAGERIIPRYRHYGTGGLNQVRKQISRALRKGHAAQVAQRYADSLAQAREEPGKRARREAQIVRVAVVRSRFIFDDYFNGSTKPAAEVVHAECAVGGTAVARDAGPLPRHDEN